METRRNVDPDELSPIQPDDDEGMPYRLPCPQSLFSHASISAASSSVKVHRMRLAAFGWARQSEIIITDGFALASFDQVERPCNPLYNCELGAREKVQTVKSMGSQGRAPTLIPQLTGHHAIRRLARAALQFFCAHLFFFAGSYRSSK